ncbi:MAG: hypothetical protein FWD61_10445 [Phycisphaerales bacterium]|nr:hypothetical protein [Phycisphaerales bacterium]
MKNTLAFVLLFALLTMVGCKATRAFPDPYPGWHNSDYTSVFGRLQRIPSMNPNNPPVWIIRFGLGSDPHGGEFALMPAEKLVGYSGGEQVQITGAIHEEHFPDYPGTWYDLQSIKMWSNYK